MEPVLSHLTPVHTVTLLCKDLFYYLPIFVYVSEVYLQL
jgi:hypothetical protein